MSYESQLEREENAIDEAVNRGDMTQAEANKELRELHRDYAAEAAGASQDAYDEEYASWYGGWR